MLSGLFSDGLMVWGLGMGLLALPPRISGVRLLTRAEGAPR